MAQHIGHSLWYIINLRIMVLPRPIITHMVLHFVRNIPVLYIPFW